MSAPPGTLARQAARASDSHKTESQQFTGASCRRNAHFFWPAKSEGEQDSSINVTSGPETGTAAGFQNASAQAPAGQCEASSSLQFCLLRTCPWPDLPTTVSRAWFRLVAILVPPGCPGHYQNKRERAIYMLSTCINMYEGVCACVCV